jgi:hypothetical protein
MLGCETQPNTLLLFYIVFLVPKLCLGMPTIQAPLDVIVVNTKPCVFYPCPAKQSLAIGIPKLEFGNEMIFHP